MPAEYTVNEVFGRDEWQGSHGPMVTYKLALVGVPGEAELNQKPASPPPTPGQVIYGHLEPGKYGQKLKKDQREGGGFNNGGGKGQDKPWPRQPTPPEDAARMLRCHSQSVAVQAVEVAIGLGVEERPKDMEAFLKLVRRTADYMDRDVETVVANAQLSLDDAQRRSEDGF